jgi:hypothetical protein
MKCKIQVTLEDEQGQIQVEDVIRLDKNVSDPGYCAGLSLQESKQLLKILQEKIVLFEAQAYADTHRDCPCCHKKRRTKDCRYIQYKTLFGTVVIPSLRLYNCKCSNNTEKTFNILRDWLPQHVSPELQYIETKWASYMAYEKTAKLLRDVLPISASHNGVTIRNHLYKTAKQQESELENKPICISGCINEWEKLPKPDKPITVGIDGGYVRSWSDKKANFEVIIGKSFSETKAAKRFGFVQTLDDHPQRRLLHTLKNQGMQENQQITFLSDGADNVRDLQYIMHPEAEYVLDWFHVTMRFTVLNQFAQGFIKSDPKEGEEVKKNLESAKWHLWHGNVEETLEHLEDCYVICEDEEIQHKNKKKLQNHLEEMSTYIENNRGLIPNYGERWRYGETIATSFVESTVNEVVTKRMVKKQQMQWTPKGAHYLLQTRTAVLNGDLAKHFESWYPGIKIGENEKMRIWEERKAA